MEGVYRVGYLTRADPAIPRWLVKVIFLGGWNWWSIKSRFAVMGLSASDSILDLLSSFLTSYSTRKAAISSWVLSTFLPNELIESFRGWRCRGNHPWLQEAQLPQWNNGLAWETILAMALDSTWKDPSLVWLGCWFFSGWHSINLFSSNILKLLVLESCPSSLQK